jgi:DNA repair protein RadC
MLKNTKSKIESSDAQKWHHPGGKLRELGAESLSDAELLSILISTGIKGKPAEKLPKKSLPSRDRRLSWLFLTRKKGGNLRWIKTKSLLLLT